MCGMDLVHPRAQCVDRRREDPGDTLQGRSYYVLAPAATSGRRPDAEH